MKAYYAPILGFACFHGAAADTMLDEKSADQTVTASIRPPKRMAPAIVSVHLLVLSRQVAEPEFPRAIEVVKRDHADDPYVPTKPRRRYNEIRNVVMIGGRELPYISILVEFVNDTTRLADVESRAALEETAAAIHEILKTRPSAAFMIEFHIDADSDDELILTLATDRARRVQQELMRRHGVPAGVLDASGHVGIFPGSHDGTGERTVLDKRVLVVRTK